MGRNAEPLETWEDRCDDDTAVLLYGCDCVDDVRALLLLMRQRRVITPAVYDKYRCRCDRISRALSVGRRNTATLRNRSPV